MKSVLAIVLGMGVAAPALASNPCEGREILRAPQFWNSHTINADYVNQASLEIYSVNSFGKETYYCEVPSRTSDDESTDRRYLDDAAHPESPVVRVTVHYAEPNPSRASDDSQTQSLQFDLDASQFTAQEIAQIRGANNNRERAAAAGLLQVQVSEVPVTRELTDYSRPEYCTHRDYRGNGPCSGDDTVYYPHRRQSAGTDYIVTVAHR